MTNTTLTNCQMITSAAGGQQTTWYRTSVATLDAGIRRQNPAAESGRGGGGDTSMRGSPAAAPVRYTARGSDSITCPICAAELVSHASPLLPACPEPTHAATTSAPCEIRLHTANQQLFDICLMYSMYRQ